MKLYIVNWQGPFDDQNLKENIDNLGLYLITGYRKHQRTKGIQYCGITEQNFNKRILNGHHKKELVTRERQYWIGKVLSEDKISRSDLETIESLIIYFWQPELNVRKKKKYPQSLVIINKWLNLKGEQRLNIWHEAQKLQDVIYWDGEYWHLSDSLRIHENS